MSDLQMQSEMLAENQIQDPKAPFSSWTLPCGWAAPDGSIVREVLVRQIKGHEEDMLASDKMTAAAKAESITLNCLQQVGAVQDRRALAEILQDLPVGDRMYLLLCVRRTTLGDKYPYMAKCPTGPECGKEDLFSVDLDECRVIPMADPKKRVFDVVLPSGIEARWHVMTGRDESRIAQYNRKQNEVTVSLLGRVELLGGKPATLASLKDLGMPDRNYLRDCFEEVEGGVDMEVEFQCEKCEHVWTANLDMTQRGFFFPLAAQRRWRTKSGS